jgi:hypothetical protein
MPRFPTWRLINGYLALKPVPAERTDYCRLFAEKVIGEFLCDFVSLDVVESNVANQSEAFQDSHFLIEIWVGLVVVLQGAPIIPIGPSLL